MPIVNGDRLKINSWTHYEDYIDDIDDIENELNLPENTDDDSTLFYIEEFDLGGFFSLRQKLNIKNGITTDGEWINENKIFLSEDFQTMFECDYIGDDIEKSI